MIIWLMGCPVTFAQGSDDTRWSQLVASVFQEVAYSEGQLGDVDKGLPFTEMPTALAVDDEGFLWVGTQNGLERWDGYGFRTYSTTGNKSGELPNNFINVLHVDAKGRLWVGTQAGGLAWYDRDNDRFVAIPVGPSGLSGRWVFSIVDDGAGGLWVGTSDGLNSISADGRRIVQYKHRDNDVGSLPDNYVRALIRDHRGICGSVRRRDSLAEIPIQGLFSRSYCRQQASRPRIPRYERCLSLPAAAYGLERVATEPSRSHRVLALPNLFRLAAITHWESVAPKYCLPRKPMRESYCWGQMAKASWP